MRGWRIALALAASTLGITLIGAGHSRADDFPPRLVKDADGNVFLISDDSRYLILIPTAVPGDFDGLVKADANVDVDRLAQLAATIMAPTNTPTPSPSVTLVPTVTVSPTLTRTALSSSTPTTALTPTAVPTWTTGMPLILDMEATSKAGGEPGATGDARVGPWSYVVTSVSSPPSVGGKPPRGKWIVVTAQLSNRSRASGVAGDGR